jgi:rhamnose transport system permease protein
MTRTVAPEETELASPSGATRTAHRLFVVRELGIALALILLIGVTAAVNPRFLTTQSMKDLLLGSTILAIMAVGQAVVIITRNVDLSVGSVLGLSAFATGSLFLAAPTAPIPVALGLGVLLGAVCGAVNGALIAAARVPALVVTLGTLYVFRGIDYTWATGKQINAADMPSGFLRWAPRRWLVSRC